jgi:uncharacterized membrane-anchored protein YhcB (DUF1043 family)
LLPQQAIAIKIKKVKKIVKSCQKVVKKLSKKCQKVVKKLSKLSNTTNTSVQRRRIGRRRRRLVFPRPGADYVAPGKNGKLCTMVNAVNLKR